MKGAKNDGIVCWKAQLEMMVNALAAEGCMMKCMMSPKCVTGLDFIKSSCFPKDCFYLKLDSVLKMEVFS